MEIERIQIFAIIGSVVIFLLIVELIRKKKIIEQYSLLWFFFGIAFIVLSIWRDGLEWIAHLVGIAYAPAALLLILVIAIFLILVQFSVIISKLSIKNDKLVQEIALLKAQLEERIEKGLEEKR